MRKIFYAAAIAGAALIAYALAGPGEYEAFLRRCKKWAKGIPLEGGEWQEYVGIKK